MPMLIAAAAIQASARTILVSPPAMPVYADTEVTTNIRFTAANGHVRFIELAFALETNSAELRETLRKQYSCLDE